MLPDESSARLPLNRTPPGHLPDTLGGGSVRQHLDDLVRELEDARGRGVNRVDMASDSLKSALKIPILTFISNEIAALDGAAKEGRPVKLRRLLLRAKKEHFRIADNARSERVEIIFGLRSNLYGKSPEELLDLANAGKNLHEKARQRLNRTAREDLADAIISLYEKSSLLSVNDIQGGMEKVDRKARCWNEFAEIRRSGEKRIALVGAPGVGKTTIAEDWVRRLTAAGASVSWLRAQPDGQVGASDIYSALTLRSGSHPDSAQVQGGISALACGASASDLIFIDDLSDTHAFERLIPPAHDSTIVGICRSATGSWPLDRSIFVETMSQEEAASELRIQFPRVHDNIIGSLAGASGGHPLLLKYVSELAANAELEERDVFDLLVDLITGEPDSILGAAIGDGESYASVVGSLAEEISVRDKYAADMLAFVSFMMPERSPLLFLEIYLCCSHPDSPSRVRFLVALRILSKYSAIRISGSCIEIDAFTKAALRSHFMSKIPDIYDRAVNVFLRNFVFTAIEEAQNEDDPESEAIYQSLTWLTLTYVNLAQAREGALDKELDPASIAFIRGILGRTETTAYGFAQFWAESVAVPYFMQRFDEEP